MNNLYPPILQSSQIPFLGSLSSYPIYFTISNVTSYDNVGHVQIRIMRQSNNKSIVNTALYPDGTIYKNVSEVTYDSTKQVYSVAINRNELKESWALGALYKVQLRFGSTPKFSSVNYFALWKQRQIENETFSEWSTVMIIKAIQAPSVYIKNEISVGSDVIESERTEPSLTPIFTGVYSINVRNKEMLNSYKFDLYEGESIDDTDEPIQTSGWLQHKNGGMDSGSQAVDTYRFPYLLTKNSKYTVTYSIRTVNGFEVSMESNQNLLPLYTFTATETTLDPLEDVTITAIDNSVYCKENGVIQIYLTASGVYTGNFVLSRSCEKDGYTSYQDLKYLIFQNQTFSNTLVFEDFTIESGIGYRYALQQENAAGVRTDPIYTSSGLSCHRVDFEFSFLYRNDVQLKLRLNQKLSSFKHTVLRSKQDTLGDQYPHLVQNGNAYYAEFPITGTISLHMDDDQTFFKWKNDGYYYKDELIIPAERLNTGGYRTPTEAVATDTYIPGINTALSDNNIFVERKFREKVEEFLNGFDYLLYRSPTEGNIIVGLMNVSLTPNAQLSRMIFDFSATAYEVLEQSIEAMDEYGIINIGEFTSLASDEITLSFGQIAWDMTKLNQAFDYSRGSKGFYNNSPTDLYDLIKQQEEISIGGGYKYSLKRVTSLWIEPFPNIDFTTEVLELYAKRAELLNEGVPEDDIRIIAITNEIAEYEKMEKALNAPDSTTILTINNAEVVVMPKRIYQLTENVRSIELTAAARPIIINYICELTQIEDSSVPIISAIDTTRIWGQISGVFTCSDRLLKAYNYNYASGDTYRVYNPRGDTSTIIYDSQGDIIVDDSNYNVYNTINIYDIIKQETQKQVELMYNTKFKVNEDGDLTDGSIFYNFGKITLFDIEAEPGTVLRIGKTKADAINVQIGPTGRYTLNPSDNLIEYIELVRKDSRLQDQIVEKPQYIIINYKCLTSQMKVVYIGG